MTMIKLKTLLFAALLIGASSCSDDDDKPTIPSPGEATEKFVIAGASATAEGSRLYLFLADNLDEGEITVVGNGYETRGETMYALNNKAFTFKYNRGDPGFTDVFQLDKDDKLKRVSQFSVKSVNVFLPYKDQKHLLAYNIGRSLVTGGTGYWLNTETNTVEREANFDQKIIYVNGQHIPNYYAFITAFFEFGDKIYSVYSPSYGGTGDKDPTGFDYQNRAFVSIFDKDMKFIKTISDSRMPFIGQYYNFMGLAQVSNGDIYAFSNGDIESSNNHSAFLRIRNDEFDQNYYWDVEVVAGKKIRAGKYLGGGKFVLAMLDRNKTTAESEGVKLAIADVVNKKLNWVSGITTKIPAVSYEFPLYTLNGKSYIPLNDQTSVTYLYSIDPVANTAKRGLKLIGIKDVSGVGLLSSKQQ